MKYFKFYFFILFTFLFFSCSNNKTVDKKYEILTYEDGSIKSLITFDNEDTIVEIKFTKNGFVNKIFYDAEKNNKRGLSFHKNGRLKGYYTVNNDFLVEDYVECDSSGNGWEVYFFYNDSLGSYQNQYIITNMEGTISSTKSYFLTHEASVVEEGENKILKLEIRIIGMKYEKSLAIIGDFETQSEVMDTFYGKKNTINCEFEVSSGEKFIRGKVFDYNGNIGDSVYGREIIFMNHFFVE